MGTSLPSGTVTFLFTDVEGSTKALDQLGPEKYAAALDRHRAIVREACGAWGGFEVDTQGDAFFLAFPTAPAALRAARTIGERLALEQLRVRIGVHTGTPLLTSEGYVGTDVHRAARIAASGHGGQIVVSQTTATLAEGESDLLLRSLGEHRFKDLAVAERVYQLGDGAFPPLRSLYRTNLPIAAFPLLGRQRELGEVSTLIRGDARLVTLVGPGGTGKTRLALQAAAESADEFPGGLWWVALAPVRDPRLLVSSLADALSVDEQPGRTLAELVAERLAGARALVLVDNAEHLLPEIAKGLAWLRDLPATTTLVTSRERLQLQGEQVYAVPPLTESDGIELFVERARAIDPDAHPSPAVAELCSRLDNLPLALELAAARTVVFSPQQILDRLGQRLDLLRAGRDSDPRQRTLRATISWSYDLLDEEEQRLFRALSVFAGDVTFEDAEDVCGADPDTLQSLLDKSLLRRRRGEPPRYWMLETIRELAAEQLAAEAELDMLRRRHAEHYLALARSANLEAEAEGEQRHHLVLPERDNLRAALAWAVENDRTLGLELLVALENFWVTSSPQEGLDWASALLDGSPEVPDRLLVRVLRLQGGMANALMHTARADELFRQGLELARHTGDERAVAIMLHRVATTLVRERDWGQAEIFASESLETHRRTGWAKGEAQALSSLGDVAHARGDLEGALALYQEAREKADAVGFRWWLAGMLAKIGAVSLELGRPDEARANAERALSMSHAMHDRDGLVYELGLLSAIDLELGDPRRAGLLRGAVESERARRHGFWVHAAVAIASPTGTDDEFERGRKAGRDLALDDAVALALGDPTGPAVR